MTDICRLCATLKRLDHLTTLADPELDAFPKLWRCCQLDFPPVHDELMPQSVCHDCVCNLNASYAFAERVQQAQETLRQAFLVDMQLVAKAEPVRVRSPSPVHAPMPLGTQTVSTDTGDHHDPATQLQQTQPPTEAAAIKSSTFKLRSVIISLHLKGYSVSEISRRLQLDEQLVHDWIFTYQTYASTGNNNEQFAVPEADPAAAGAVLDLMDDTSDHFEQYTVIGMAEPDSGAAPVDIEIVDGDGGHEQQMSSEALKTETIDEMIIEESNSNAQTDQPISLDTGPTQSSYAPTADQTPAQPQPAADRIDILDIVDADNRHPDGTISAAGVQLLLSATGQRTLPTWEDYPWPCCRCPQPTECGSAAGLRRHYQTEHAPARTRYACRDCALSFLRYRTFVEHVRTVHEPLLRLSCDVCSTLFWDAERLVAHRAAHGRNATKFEVATATGATDVGDGAAAAAEEEEEEVTASDAGAARVLDAVRMDFLMSGEDVEQQWKPMRIHRCGGKSQRRKAVQCQAEDAEQLEAAPSEPGDDTADGQPLAALAKQQVYACDMCCKTFKTHVRLLKHRTVHTGQKPYKCDQCGREFREKGTLREHVRIHTGAMPFACEFCGKRFRFKGVLTTHRRQHTGERPYSCIECNHHFTNWPNYNKHMKRKHGINTSVNVRKPQAIPPSGMPTMAKLNHVVPTAENDSQQQQQQQATNDLQPQPQPPTPPPPQPLPDSEL